MKISRIALFVASLLPLNVLADDTTYQVCSTMGREIFLQQGLWEEKITPGNCYPKNSYTPRGPLGHIIIQLDSSVNLRVIIPSEYFKGKTSIRISQIERTDQDCSQRPGGHYVNAKITGEVDNQGGGQQPLILNTCVRK